MDPTEAYVDAAAQVLGLRIAATSKPGVLRFFKLAAEMAALVEGLPLTVADEPGSVFRPIAPQGDS